VAPTSQRHSSSYPACTTVRDAAANGISVLGVDCMGKRQKQRRVVGVGAEPVRRGTAATAAAATLASVISVVLGR
jgi:hypothetical protein